MDLGVVGSNPITHPKIRKALLRKKQGFFFNHLEPGQLTRVTVSALEAKLKGLFIVYAK